MIESGFRSRETDPQQLTGLSFAFAIEDTT
jgi:hypothetical protein